MAVGFGFSISDLCMGLKLIKDSVEAFDTRKGSAKQFGDLIREVDTLQECLRSVQDLLADETLPHQQHVALERATYACQQCIVDFLDSISKYQPHLQAGAKGFLPKFRKIQWALCHKEDVKTFRDHLGRHSSSINMLLTTLQAKRALGRRESTDGTVSVANAEANLAAMMQTLSFEQRQCFLLIMNQNKQLLQSVQDMRKMLEYQASVPPQVLLQQPVILLDPLGRLAPFHLDFIDSSECFIAVLRARFSRAGVSPSALSKLDEQEFAIQDSRGKRPIDLDKPWNRVFHPGQHVDMRMTFHRFACPPSTCPSCHESNDKGDDDDDDEVECHGCGLFYQNLQAISKSSRDWTTHMPSHGDVIISGEQIPYIVRRANNEPQLKVFRPPTEAEDAHFDGYRRIQLVSQPLALLDPMFPALQLIEDFIHFADLLEDVPTDISPYQANISHLHQRAKVFMMERDSDFLAFSSFSQIEQVRRRLTTETLTLRHYIDLLVKSLCNDPNTKELVKYIKPKAIDPNRTGYYAGALKVMVNLSETAKSRDSKIPRPISKDKMEWRMLSPGPGKAPQTGGDKGIG